MPAGSRASSPQPLGHPTGVPQIHPDPPGWPGQRQHLAAALGQRARPLVLADERALPVPAPLAPLLPGEHLRRGSTVAVHRSVALALALVAEASASGSWVAAVGLPDLGVVAAAEAGIALDRLALVPAPTRKNWAAVVATLLDAIDVVLVRPPAGVRAADARRLAARARERGSVLVPLGDGWTDPVDLHLAVTASRWRGLGQGHGRLEARWVEVAAAGRGAAARERHVHLWLPAHTPSWAASRPPDYVRPAGAGGDALTLGARTDAGAADALGARVDAGAADALGARTDAGAADALGARVDAADATGTTVVRGDPEASTVRLRRRPA